ncbi:MAG TPA: STAS domain-containing protein [Phycisphaerae bacterium]|nr:STAS domain-containing protein [Phycisphaerae bacterium]HNU45463.1 STAS domain-containing protein [Phycisphaerae bacterium]
MSEPRTAITVTEVGNATVVNFEDRKILEELSISRIGEELAALVSSHVKINLLLSFKNVEHLSSSALGMLITLNTQVKERQGVLKLSDISPQIFEVFKITRLNKLFSIYSTREEALAAFPAAAKK